MDSSTFIENLPFGVIVFNCVGVITNLNNETTQLLKLNKHNMLGKEWHNLGFRFFNQHGVELTHDKHSIVELIKENKSVKNEVVGVVHTNIQGTLWVNINVAFESNKETCETILYLTDISDIVESKIVNSEIIDSIKLGTWTWNIDTGEAEYCTQWAQMLGYSLDELRPLTIDVWRNLVHPDDLKKYDAILQDHFLGKIKQYEGVLRMHHKDGHWEWIHTIGKVALWSDEEEPLYMTGIHENVSNFKRNELELSQKIEYGKILNDISTQFINSNDIDTTITESFGKLASLTHASRVYLFRIDAKTQTMSNTHEWCSKGVSSQKEMLQELPLTSFPWWMKKLSNDEIINISDVSKMRLEAKAEKEILEKQEVKSVFVLPVNIKQSLVGFLGFDNVLSSESWTVDDIDFLRTTVSVFSYALDRQQIEEALNRNYLNFQAYFDLNTDFIMILNEKGEIIEINKQITKKLGYTPDDIIGKHALTLHPAEYYKEAQEVFDAMREGHTSSCPLPILTKSGKKILVETSLTKGVWDGEAVYFGVSKDVSEKVLSLEKYEKIFQNIPTIAGLIDTSTGKYIEVNKVFLQKLGYTYDEVMNSRVVDLLKIDAESYYTLSSKIVEKGFIDDFETEFYHKDGSAIDVLSFATHISLLDKKYILTLATDITQTKQYARELVDAKMRAEESDRLKSAFLATMNHELRTPLNHIIGFSSMLPDMVEDASIKEFLKLIHNSGLSLLSIIEDIFDLAMIDQVEIKLRQDTLFIRDLYLELKNQLQEFLFESDKSNSIDLDFKIDSNILTKKIITDKSKVMQVVANLIKNAVKFTHKGTVSLAIFLENDNLISIILKDTGIGIPKDKQDMIFDFFRQVDDSHTREYGGIGIGLAISQKIARAMGGKISLDSIPTVGSEFKFSFPVKLQSEEFVDEQEISNALSVPDLSENKILIVEDNPVSMGVVENMLLITQCEIFKASNGVEALEAIIEHNSIQLVLMDLKMPFMDGFEATQKIRKQRPYLPIIALTAYNFQKDREKALQVGCNDILTKPVNRAMLLRKIENYLIK